MRLKPGVGMCGTQEPIGSGVPGGTYPNYKNMGSGFQANWAKVGSGGFRVPGWNPKSGFRVPSRNPKSGFQWVPGSGSEPKKWVPVGSGFRPNFVLCRPLVSYTYRHFFLFLRNNLNTYFNTEFWHKKSVFKLRLNQVEVFKITSYNIQFITYPFMKFFINW